MCLWEDPGAAALEEKWVFGLPSSENWPQIPTNGRRELVEGAIWSLVHGDGITRCPDSSRGPGSAPESAEVSALAVFL